jgi:MoaA/NifB/PqqE/SkfB family radical SAM enzyme
MTKPIFYLKTFKSYIGYKIGKPIPFLIDINPTIRCNLKCKYCTNRGIDCQDKLSSDEMMKLVDQIAQLGIPYITLSGGEPLLIQDIEIVGDYAMQKGICVNLNTNGTLITKHRAKFIANSFNHVRISLDGPRKVHDRLAGKSGTYEKVIRAINYLSEIKQRKAKIGINCVINRDYKSYLAEIKCFAQKVDFVSFLPKFNFRQAGINCVAKVPKEIINLQKELAKLSVTGNTKEFLQGTNLEHSKQICDAGRLYLSIGPSGSVYACPFGIKGDSADSYLGTIREKSLSEILYMNKKKDFSKRCSGCYATCTTEVSRIFRMSPWNLAKNLSNLRRTYKL